jgi:hypothetical protein
VCVKGEGEIIERRKSFNYKKKKDKASSKE